MDSVMTAGPATTTTTAPIATQHWEDVSTTYTCSAYLLSYAAMPPPRKGGAAAACEANKGCRFRDEPCTHHAPDTTTPLFTPPPVRPVETLV